MFMPVEDQAAAQRDPALEIWAAHWRAQADMPPRDFMCETIWRALHEALAPHGVEIRLVRGLDRLLAWLFGGYLLVSVFRKACEREPQGIPSPGRRG